MHDRDLVPNRTSKKICHDYRYLAGRVDHVEIQDGAAVTEARHKPRGILRPQLQHAVEPGRNEKIAFLRMQQLGA